VVLAFGLFALLSSFLLFWGRLSPKTFINNNLPTPAPPKRGIYTPLQFTIYNLQLTTHAINS
jgi:hypothetical protein